MKIIKILLIILVLTLMLSSCGKTSNEKDDIFYGYEHKSETTTEKSPYIIDGQDVSSDSFEMHIPEEYSLTENGNLLRIENENNTLISQLKSINIPVIVLKIIYLKHLKDTDRLVLKYRNRKR